MKTRMSDFNNGLTYERSLDKNVVILKFDMIMFQNDLSPKINVKIDGAFSLMTVDTLTVKQFNFIFIHMLSIE
jgi:hypothetical protein